MNTARFIIVLILLAFFSAGCGNPKCQAPAPEKIPTFTANPWRLVSSTDPGIKKLDRFNFTILSFSKNNKGDIKAVQNNTQYDAPLYTFDYIVSTEDAKSGQLRIVFYGQAKEEEGEAPSGEAPKGEASKPKDYEYQLTRELVLSESRTGYEYKYIPFQGIVDPDSNCTF